MEIILTSVIILVLAVIFYTRRKEHLAEVHKNVALKLGQNESWKKEKFLSFGEVQEIRQVLEREIREKFEDQEIGNTLIEIVNEWAELRIKTFQDRRSWVREPETHDEKTPIKSSDWGKHY